MLLCRRHHTLVHEGGLIVERDALGAPTFVRPDGRIVEAVPPPPPGSSRRLINAGSATALQCWDGARFNLGYVVDALRTPPAAS